MEVTNAQVERFIKEGFVRLDHAFPTSTGWLVHAAQPHRGTRPRFMAQPPLLLARPFQLQGDDGAGSPVELAIRHGLGRC